jgi:hypothetical protein
MLARMSQFLLGPLANGKAIPDLTTVAPPPQLIDLPKPGIELDRAGCSN